MNFSRFFSLSPMTEIPLKLSRFLLAAALSILALSNSAMAQDDEVIVTVVSEYEDTRDSNYFSPRINTSSTRFEQTRLTLRAPSVFYETSAEGARTQAAILTGYKIEYPTSGEAVEKSETIEELAGEFTEVTIQLPNVRGFPAGLPFTFTWLWSEPKTGVISIESRYGADRVRPPVGVSEVNQFSRVTFEAPAAIYLDEAFTELEPTEANIISRAPYQAVPIGYSIDGQNNVQLSGEKTASLTITRPVQFTWIWEIQYGLLVEADSADGTDVVGESDVLDANPSPELGKHWYGKGEAISLSIDGLVGDQARRKRLIGYQLLNKEESSEPTEDDTFQQVVNPIPIGLVPNTKAESPSNSERLNTLPPSPLDAPWPNSIEALDKEGPIFDNTGFNLEFWMKIDGTKANGDLPSFRISEKITYLDDDGTGFSSNDFFDLTLQQTSDGGNFTLTKRFSENDAGSFEIVVSSLIMELPAFEIDNNWQHWALDYIPETILPDGVIPARYRLFRNTILIAESFSESAPDPMKTAWGKDKLSEFIIPRWRRDSSIGSLLSWKVDGLEASWRSSATLDGPASYNNLRVRPQSLSEDEGIARAQLDGYQRVAFADLDQHEWPLNEGDQVFDPVLQSTTTVMFEEDTTFTRFGGLQAVMNDWKRIRWLWEGEVRYRFDALGESLEDFTDQAFVRYYNREGTAIERTVYNSGQNTDAWVPIGRKVEVGSFYRTNDRCFTLDNFITKPGADLGFLSREISDLTDVVINDREGQSRLARIATIRAAKDPTEAHFVLFPTIFRAEIPLGEAFDSRNPNAYLVPELCEGAQLRTEELISDGFSLIGLPFRWDQLGSRLFPVEPEINTLNWPDAVKEGVSYQIQIVSGFPNDAVNLPYQRENKDGTRQGSAPDYITSVTLSPADGKFPAAPGAHYRHHYDTEAERTPPTKLDLSATDNWKYQEMTFKDRDTTTVQTAVPGIAFTAEATGRSVLLYSYRPNPDEIADGTMAQITNGTLTDENLAVRIVHSTPVNPISPYALAYPHGRQGLLLGTGAGESDGAMGVISRGGSTVAVDPGPNFVLDFWLNTGDLKPDAGQVKVISTGDNRLEVVLNPATATITASYFDISTTHSIPAGGAGWNHYVIHVFGETFLGVPVTLLDFYANGVRVEDGFITAFLPAGSSGAIPLAPSLTATSLKFGAGADQASALLLDQCRLFRTPGTYLQAGEIRHLRETRNSPSELSAPPREAELLLHFDFETEPTDPGTGVHSFASTVNDVGVGPITNTTPAESWGGSWTNLDIEEVATQLESPLDNAGFNGGGFILNGLSNYNASLYNRDAEVGTWGPIFPVNHDRLFTEENTRLEVAYYENPYLVDRISHPNVAWPHREVRYDEVTFPRRGPHKDKAIYIASRVGSEGVDETGKLQTVFKLDQYANLQIYNQPNDEAPGYNPNEEHALAAGANRAALKIKEIGEDIPNNPPLAAFALQNDLNVIDGASYTSEPWVLIQVDNVITGEPEMAAYRVNKTRFGRVSFPSPTDFVVNATEGLAYESAANPEDRFLTMDPEKLYNFSYAFSYPVAAGDLLIPPYPLNLVIGNTAMSDARGNNHFNQRTIWRDVNGIPWVISGNGSFFYQYFYPFRGDFYLPGTPLGTPVAWVPDEIGGTRDFIGNGQDLEPGRVVYHSFWRSSYPKLKRGETLTYQGGEYFNENPGANGLPALVAMKAAEVIFDVATPTMIIGENNIDNYSARIIRPLDRHEARFTVAEMADAGFSPAAPSIFVVAERWYFKDLPGSLQRRFYFDSLAEKLVFRGYLNDKDSGDPDLTSGPDPLNILEPNVITFDDRIRLQTLSESSLWQSAITAIHQKSQNPDFVRTEAPPTNPVITGRYMAGMKESPVVTKRIGLNLDLLGANADLEAEEARLEELTVTQRTLETGWNIELLNFYDLLNGQISANSIFPPSAEETRLRMEISRLGYEISQLETQRESRFSHLDSFGVGSALVPSPELLTSPVNGSRFITIVENNRSELDGSPISLHIIELIPDRYRGALKVIEAADAFSEKVTIQHSGEFGGNTNDLYYEWWIRDAAPLDVVAQEVFADGTLAGLDAQGNSAWQEYQPKSRVEDDNLNDFQKRLGLHSIVFEGSPEVVLADKLVLMRYRHKDETDWKLVPFEITNPVAEWQPGTPAPFQWAGAANSPQLQADGSKRYIPQLVMGWVKRVLDRINPYEARYNDFFSNESPATYSSQIQIAGAPYAGKVALNSDKNVIENTGLIELYETVLQRAKELSIDNSSNAVSTDGINQALLLAATRLAVLYELLAREAYGDAQDAAITVTADDINQLGAVSSFTHAFQGLESDLLNEELSLLRGTDFRKSFPVFNRMFWNYTKGLGEAAYNVNYNIYDENTDGFINEDDARALYPQGHGDAWGHFISALGMHYALLQQPVFSWKSRSELYSLMQNVLEVDYLDEKTFAKLAAGKARAGRDIVRGTYRLHYTQDPDGQWQGYSDGADPARAWGVSEWAHRAGQASYFDWTVANALLPEDAGDATPVVNPENLDRIERSGAEDEIGEVAAGLLEIQTAMDEANNGVNPLGFDADAIAFDIDPNFLQIGSGIDGETHFTQIYNRALTAGSNALATLDFASRAENKLRALADDTDGLIAEALRQDIDYRNRLIEIFGRPYDGTIGFGKAYPEGYEGPDTLLFAYLDRTEFTDIIPPGTGSTANPEVLVFDNIKDTVRGLASDPTLLDLYYDSSGTSSDELTTAVETFILGNDYDDPTRTFSMPIRRASNYAFQAPGDWGQRTSYGSTQRALEDMLREEIELKAAVDNYIAFLGDYETLVLRLLNEIELIAEREILGNEIQGVRAGFNTALVAGETAVNVADELINAVDNIEEIANEAAPTVNGLSNDVTSALRATAATIKSKAGLILRVGKVAAQTGVLAAELVRDEVIEALERDGARLDYVSEIEGMMAEIELLSGAEAPLRAEIGGHLQSLETIRQEYFTAQAEGFRLLREREAFNKILAASVQKNRYQDMLFRLSRNEAMSKYQSTFNHAARYTWLATKAYDYETSLDPGDPASPTQLYDQIVKTRQLGLWSEGEPQIGQGGLAEILASLKGNFQVLEGQLGLNNVQVANEDISLRGELFRIGPDQESGGSAASDERWEDALKARFVDDLWQVPEFRRHCRPFANSSDGEQPGLVIRFRTAIEPGQNFFGRPLLGGDHTYSTANYSTKIATAGVSLEGYPDGELATTPRAYLVPVGNDYLRVSTANEPVTRMWNVHDTRIPTPFTINQSQITAPGFIPSLDGVDGRFNAPRRHGDFRMYHEEGADPGDDEQSSRLIGRSIWNSEWLLIIPGTGLHADPNFGLKEFAENVSDLKLYFKTYSHNGQ